MMLLWNTMMHDDAIVVNFTVTLDDPKMPIFPSILHVNLSERLR